MILKAMVSAIHTRQVLRGRAIKNWYMIVQCSRILAWIRLAMVPAMIIFLSVINLCSWLDRSVSWVSFCEARGWESDSPLGLQREEPTWVALGKLHSPRAPPEEGNGKLFLSTVLPTWKTLKGVTMCQNGLGSA